MKTKFIGLEGFNEIESLSTKQKRQTKIHSKKLNTAQKTIRFIKRASVLCGKTLKIKSCKLLSAVSKKAMSKSSVKAKNSKPSILDKCYIENRTGINGEYSGSAKEAIATIPFSSGKKYAHSAPVQGRRAHTIMKKRAILAVVACFAAITLSCVTVASALDFSDTPATVSSSNSKIYSSVPVQSESVNNDSNEYIGGISTADEAVSSINSDAYVSMAKALINDNIKSGCAGLYIDGKLIGATTESDALKAALENVLVDYREGYDEATTTEFANDVVVKNGNFDDSQLMSVDEIMSLADGKFSIALSTDIVYTRTVIHQVKTEYDDSKPSSYKKVKTEGKDGKSKVTVRTTFVDGVQTDAVDTDTEIIEKAVDEVVIKGSQGGAVSESESYASSGSFMWPLPYTHNITSYFEWRWGRMHQGIDISAGGVYGESIVAADGGTVTLAGNYGDGYGNYVIIDHGNGYQTLYGHCSSLAVSEGQHVSKGQTIGYVGSTGNSTGPHLHFEVRNNGTQLNPLNFVN